MSCLFTFYLSCQLAYNFVYCLWRRGSTSFCIEYLYVPNVCLQAALVLIWIAYCMFVRERHKSECYQYNIADLERRREILSAVNEAPTETKKEITAGVFILPSLRKPKNEGYYNRPDYPESPPPMSHPSTDRLINILDGEDHGCHTAHYSDGICEVVSHQACSDV